ncbi:sigma-70 family RNA polymerase sigma factor [Streptomyces sp. NPDC047108]|uniref:sigma-70 family RNA polymerase sigma factor n=1 Tax=Streptomyces sp. NPDC047108 TaxID=3155025 RepID=UPI0033CD0645
MRDDTRVTEWALAARSGDQDAVEAFVRGTQLDVRRYVTHLSGDAQAADDLVQDTYLRALRSLPGFEGRSSARTWLLTIARRTVADRIRAHSARPRLAGVEDWQSAAERAQPRGLPGFEEGVALSELLSALPSGRREAFVLTQLLGLPYAEAASVAECPVGTVRSRVARARETLMALLNEAEEPPPSPRADAPARPPVRSRPTTPVRPGTGRGAGTGRRVAALAGSRT